MEKVLEKCRHWITATQHEVLREAIYADHAFLLVKRLPGQKWISNDPACPEVLVLVETPESVGGLRRRIEAAIAKNPSRTIAVFAPRGAKLDLPMKVPLVLNTY